MNDRVDIVIVGAGPAGMAAAIKAKSLGARSVVVLDEQAMVGGQIWRNVGHVSDQVHAILGPDYSAGQEVATAFSRADITHIGGATVWNITQDKTLNYVRQHRSYELRAKAILLCTGAQERPFPVSGWTLPGVMTAGAAQVLLKGSGIVPAQSPILIGCGPLLYLLCWQYICAGIKIKAVLDTTTPKDYMRAVPALAGAIRGWRYVHKGLALIARIKKERIPFYKGVSHLRLLGDSSVSSVGFQHRGRDHFIDTRLVFLHQGVVPNTQFTWVLRAKHSWSASQLCWIPDVDETGQLVGIEGIYVAGDGKGIAGFKAALYQGELAAISALTALGIVSGLVAANASKLLREKLDAEVTVRPFLEALYRPQLENRVPDDSVIVCRCEELTAGAIRQFVAEGCQGPNQAKSFGRCGMGPCQGRMCGLTVTELMSRELGSTPQDVGYYRIRAPIKPITLAELATIEDLRSS